MSTARFQTPIHTLTGHDDAVTCLATSPELDIVVSASEDGSVVVHTLFRGTYVRTLDVNGDGSIATPAAGAVGGGGGRSGGGGDGPDPLHKPDATATSPPLAPMGAVGEARAVEGLELGAATLRSVGRAPARCPRIHWVGVSSQGYILTYSREDRCLSTYSINGVRLARVDVGECLYSFLFSHDGSVLLTGGDG